MITIEQFKQFLQEDEKSPATIEKYLRDVRYFLYYIGDKIPVKQDILDYKKHLGEQYAVRSANSMIASLNSYLRFTGRHHLCVKQYKIQQEAYCSAQKELTKEEYMRLIRAAEHQHNRRLSLIVQTICATGIRVSELSAITVEAVRKGEAVVSCKGKIRKIFLVRELRDKLKQYIAWHGIQTGMIFTTRNGKPMSRSNIWREMKNLCKRAGVSPEKVFPHNLRHLFARTFYGIEKDLAKLADILGHSNINTTRIYIMTTGYEHQKRMENLRLLL